MSLAFSEHLKHLVPGFLYYPHKIAKNVRLAEPELRILKDLVPAGCRALDVGANRGYYSYALSKVAGRVDAFEPHPELVRFIRRKLSVTVHEVALSNRDGWATFYVPQKRQGIDAHYNSSLKKVYDNSYSKYVELPVRVMMLDQFNFDDVGFIKIDAEGSDMDVIEGGRQTIARCRPNMVVEITHWTHADPIACIDQIASTFGYQARIMVGGRLIDAREALADPALVTCNVVFTPR